MPQIMAESRWHEEAVYYNLNPHIQAGGRGEIKIATEREQREVAGEEEEDGRREKRAESPF